MPPQVIVYSPDVTRGLIVQRVLAQQGIRGRLLATWFELEAAALRVRPAVMVVDAGREPAAAAAFCKSLARRLPRTEFVLFSSPDADRAAAAGEPANSRIQHLAGPFDPDRLGKRVGSALMRTRWGFLRLVGLVEALRKWLLKNLKKGAAVLTALAAGLVSGYLFWCIDTMPPVDSLEDYAPYEASAVYSSDNVLLTEFYVERRNFISQDRIPGNVKTALLAVEDSRFYRHHGIDLFRIIGALLTNIRQGGYVQGGSTITQQLAKMLFLSPDKTITRKIQEIVLSLQLETRYSKDEILGLYCNQAYFGSRAYGIDAAAHAYFGKLLDTLTIAEAALLASLLKAPSDYSPFKSPLKALERRDYALLKMRETGKIDMITYKEAMKAPLPEKFHAPSYRAPYFVDYCRPILEKKYGQRIYTSGLKIYTTLDYRLQQVAEKVLASGISALGKRGIEGIQAALVAIDLETGGILAMVGGTDYPTSQFNRATQAMRQPGSAFKPVVYLTALSMGFSPDHTIEDQLVTYRINHRRDRWTPHNYGNVYYQKISLRAALAKSLNAATVNLAKKVKIGNIAATARKLGIQSKIHRFYSSALGASEMTLLELVSAYAALATGWHTEPTGVNRIIDREQLAMVEPAGRRERAIQPKNLAQIRSMLRAVVTEGTGSRARVLDRAVYGKTGTTNAHADALFVGFDHKMAVGVWVGRDDRAPIGKRETGASAALPIWVDFMAEAGTSP